MRRTESADTQADKTVAVAAEDGGFHDGVNGAPSSSSLSLTAASIKPEAAIDTPAVNGASADASIVVVRNNNGHAPNSKPRKAELEEDTYVYRDFSTILAPPQPTLNPQSLQAQKLPAKLAAMLSDQGKSILSLLGDVC
jgi:hypothetical protein